MFLLLPVALENNDSFVWMDYVVCPLSNSIEVITLAYIVLLFRSLTNFIRGYLSNV
jgi:hypothetical protein